ncbi:Dehydrogenase/reductase SDR family member 4 [Aphelenchoides bicaudatus]|nr:Dehydrogenase/reductase SDR family member 4 [Aphelenchoides bicaudatus]
MTSKYNARRLDGKVAVVTASTDGIGYAIAERLGHEGCKVVISSRRQANVDKALNSLVKSGLDRKNVAGIECHVANNEHRKRLLKFAVEQFGAIHILVNNAGINPAFGDIIDITESEWDKLFDVNVKATFLLTQQAVPIIQKSGGGSIIFNASTGAYSPPSGIAAYGITKTCLLAMTKAFSQSLAPLNIRVNAVAPGLVRTKMAQTIVESDVVKEQGGFNDLKRVGEPQEIGGAVAYLVSSDASYVTGETHIVSGGTPSRL